MESVRLVASRRQQSGKGSSRRLRSGAQIPAVAYGKEMQAMSLSVSPADVQKVLSSVYGRNIVIDLEIDGNEKFKSLVRDVQHHPVSRHLLHADFLRIDENAPVDVSVPLELVGKAKGVVIGGLLEAVYRKLPIRCLPKDIPVKLTVDVSELGIEETVSVEDLVLPAGVSVNLKPQQTIAGVYGKRKEQEEEAAAAAPGAPAAGAAAGAAAAGDKKAGDKKAGDKKPEAKK